MASELVVFEGSFSKRVDASSKVKRTLSKRHLSNTLTVVLRDKNTPGLLVSNVSVVAYFVLRGLSDRLPVFHHFPFLDPYRFYN
jgi:hypothetical protein